MRQLFLLGAFLTLTPAADVLAQQASPQPAATQQPGTLQPGAQQPSAQPTAMQPPGAQPAAVQQPGAQQADEPPPGQRTLNLCRACHTINQGQRTLIGPNLYGVFGRRAASIEGFRYSANMRQLGETGHTWSDETLRPYLTNPKAVAPQGAMSFPGIPDEQELKDVIALLKKVTGGSGS